VAQDRAGSDKRDARAPADKPPRRAAGLHSAECRQESCASTKREKCEPTRLATFEELQNGPRSAHAREGSSAPHAPVAFDCLRGPANLQHPLHKEKKEKKQKKKNHGWDVR